MEPIGSQPQVLPKFSGLIESISCHRIALDISLPQSLDRREILEFMVKKILTHQARKIAISKQRLILITPYFHHPQLSISRYSLNKNKNKLSQIVDSE